jgi:hypothetical protein
METRWQKCDDRCLDWPACKGKVWYELTTTGQWEVRPALAKCDACALPHRLEAYLGEDEKGKVRRSRAR